MDFAPTSTQSVRPGPATDKELQRATPVFVAMDTEQNGLSPVKPTQVRVRDGERFDYEFGTALIVL